MKKPYYLHWCSADPFNRFVVLVIGDYKASFKELDRTFKIKKNSAVKLGKFSDGLADCLEKNPPEGSLDHCGRTIHRKTGDDVFVWFPAFPTPGTLAHELMHAKDIILNAAGVTDTSGETDAYLLGAMYDHFFSVIEKDKAKEARSKNPKGAL